MVGVSEGQNHGCRRRDSLMFPDGAKIDVQRPCPCMTLYSADSAVTQPLRCLVMDILLVLMKSYE